MKIIRGRLSPSDVSNAAYRYNPDCDCVQYSPNGGATWNDAPEADPRHANAFRLPARTGTDRNCNAAANMVSWLKGVIDECTRICGVGGVVVALVNKILDFAEVIFAEEGGILLTLIQAVAGTIFDVGYAALTANFTSHEYDLLLCIFYCRIGSDGQVSVDQFAQIQSDITAQLNTIAAIVVNLFLSLQGEVGLSNAGAQGNATADCSDCACEHCHEYDFTASDGGFTPFVADGLGRALYVAGVGWGTSLVGGYTQIDSPSLPSGLNVRRILMLWPEGHTPDFGRYGLRVPDVSGSTSSQTNPDGALTIDGQNWVYYDVDETVPSFWLTGDNSGASQILQKLRITYIGTEAFGGDNC